MEKLFMIAAEICAFILSLLCVYHWSEGHSGGMSLFFALLFMIMGAWCHKIQRTIKFDFRLW